MAGRRFISPFRASSLVPLIAACGLTLACGKSSKEPAETPAPTATEAAQPETAPAATTVDAAVAEAPPAVESETRTLTIDPSSLQDDGKGHMKLCLDCKVRKATYEYCLFEANEQLAKLGEEPVTVSVSMTPRASENYVPDDPNAPQPEGGFTHKLYDCKLQPTAGE